MSGPALGCGTMRHVRLRCYDDDALPAEAAGPSVFLAGPTRRALDGVASLTPWRMRAVELFRGSGFAGTLVIPEFRERTFADAVAKRFGGSPSEVPGMKSTSCGVLAWETAGIERASVVLFWMPFALSDDDASLPGFTTRAEVSRELVRDPSRLVLGMPEGSLSSSHIRFHAHAAGLAVHSTLEETVAAALRRMAGA